MPVVSPNAISSQPAAARRCAIPNTRSSGTSPSYGQPNETEITPSQRSPASRARATTRSSPASDSSIERFTFLRLCVSLADRKRFTSSNSKSPRASARSSPRSFGISTVYETSALRSMERSTCSASASCGITSGRTNDVTSIRRRPGLREAVDQPHLVARSSITSGSFWKPSRGPTSRMRTLLRHGTPLDHRKAAAHPERLACHVRGVVRAEERDRGGDLVRGAQAPQRGASRPSSR